MDEKSRLGEILAEWNLEQEASPGTWFGHSCVKTEGRLFALLSGSDLAFKLSGEAHAEALQIEGAHLLDPGGQGRPMKAWVQIPVAQSATWGHFARLACEQVAGAAQVEKETIIQALVTARQKILNAARRLSPEQQDAVFLGTWSVKELLAHLVGWDHTNLTAVGEILAGQKLGFWEHYDRDWRSYNDLLVARHRRDDVAELIGAVERSHRKLIDHLESVPADAYLKRKRIGTLLRTEARDEEEHYRQLEEFRRRGALRS